MPIDSQSCSENGTKPWPILHPNALQAPYPSCLDLFDPCYLKLLHAEEEGKRSDNLDHVGVVYDELTEALVRCKEL